MSRTNVIIRLYKFGVECNCMLKVSDGEMIFSKAIIG